MKSVFTLTAIIFISLFTRAQVFEHLEDRGVYNSYSDIIQVGDSMWVAIGSYNGITSLSAVYIQAFDASGGVLWETELSEEEIELQDLESIEILPNGNFLVSSTATSCCDCLPRYPLTYVFGTNGELLFEQSYENSLVAQGNGMAFTEDEVARVIRQNGDPATYQLKVTSHELSPEWTFDSGPNQIRLVTAVNNEFAIFRSGEIILLNENGDEADSANIEEVPQEVYTSPNGRNFLLMSDGLHELNSDLTTDLVVPEINVEPERIFIDNENVYILNSGTSSVDQYDMDFFNLTSTVEFENLPYFNLNAFVANDSNLCFAGQKTFEEVSAPHTSSYSGAALFTTDFSGSTLAHNPDIGLNITDMQIDDYYLYDEEYGVYLVSATLSGYVKNEGDVVIDRFHLNYYHMGGCFTAGGERVVYEDVNLQPGDSIAVSISDVDEFSFDNDVFEQCAFVSDPSNFYDRNELNDLSCGSALFIGIKENQLSDYSLYPNPTSDWLNLEFEKTTPPELIEIRDLSGRLVRDYKQSVKNGKASINVSSLTSGVYILRVTSKNEKVSTARFIIQ